MITVSDVIKNSSLSAFPVVCGCAGLESEVIKTGIIDYEFSIEGFLKIISRLVMVIFGCKPYVY